MFWVEAAIEIKDTFPFISGAYLQAFVIVGYPPGEFRGDYTLGEHIGTKAVNHFLENSSGLSILIRSWKHLAVGETVAIRMVVLYVSHSYRIITPGVGDKDFAIDPELFVEPFFVILRLLSNVAHSEEVGLFQCASLSRPQHPEVRQGTMIPEKELIAVLVEFGDPHTIFIRRSLLRDGIHADFRQIEICPDTDRSGDAGGSENVPYHGHGHDVRRVKSLTFGFLPISSKIRSCIDERFVHGIDMYVIGSRIPQDDGIDLC